MIYENKHDIAFGVNIEGFSENTFLLTQFSADESLSKPFVIGAKIACKANKDLKIADIVNRLATLTIHHKYKQLVYDGVYENAGVKVPVREFNGVIESIAHIATDYDWTTLHITIMPALHRLRHSSDCRIFQKISVPDIIKKIFGERGVTDFEFVLKDAVHQQEREYCVQYNESHLSFIQRLLAEEGIFYYFKHEAGKHIMVLTDMSQGGDKLKPNPLVEYNHQTGGMIKAQYVSQLIWRESLRPDQVTHREYCFKKPYYDQEHEKATATTPAGDGIPTGYDKFYYHDRYKEPKQGQAFVQYQLESERADATQGEGVSNLIHFSAGKRFSLAYHKIEALNTDYLLVSVSHNGSQPQALGNAAGDGAVTYSNNFDVIKESTQPWRPPRIHKPTIKGSQIAHVVGPAGEEIYTDKYGRVKLHFMWDRYSKKNDTSSCWIRVSQAWAGRGYGMVAIPRIGHEVIVDFLEGDPDQPIVIGRTYHDGNPHPYKLPDNKTQTGTLTRSSKGGDASNANQLRFEDKKGHEEIYIHAEKDRNCMVENNLTQRVNINQVESVGHNKAMEVANNHVEVIGGNMDLSIGPAQTGKIAPKVMGVAAQGIGARSYAYGTPKTSAQGIGNLKLSVEKNKNQTIGKIHSESVGTIKETFVGKSYYLDAKEEIVIEAGKRIVLKSGKSVIVLNKDGTITLSGKKMLCTFDELIRLVADIVDIN